MEFCQESLLFHMEQQLLQIVNNKLNNIFTVFFLEGMNEAEIIGQDRK